jgi:hypothetical protein
LEISCKLTLVSTDHSENRELKYLRREILIVNLYLLDPNDTN